MRPIGGTEDYYKSAHELAREKCERELPLPPAGRVREGGAQQERRFLILNRTVGVSPPPLTPPARGGEYFFASRVVS